MGMLIETKKSVTRRTARLSTPPESLVSTVHRGDVTHDDIARRAYEIWQLRGQDGGSAEDHWLEAESELRRA